MRFIETAKNSATPVGHRRRWPAGAVMPLILAIGAGWVVQAQAATVQPLYRFAPAGKAASGYSFGSTPDAELLQASDGNFYGTTANGGAGLCPNPFGGGVVGCGTIFRITRTGTLTTLYSFPYDTSTSTPSAPNGAYPTAGLIQGKDGYLYGVAQDGGLRYGCNGALGCGTAFRISTAGVFTLLHQFNDSDGNGGRPLNHLVQAADGRFYGVANEGGVGNQGTLFSMTAAGGVTLLHQFNRDIGNDGYDPTGALLVGHDGKTLYGTTTFGGANGGGLIFRYADGVLTTLHAFDNLQSTAAGTCFQPTGALIFGRDGKLYGTTPSGGFGGCLFSISTAGTGFKVLYVFNGTGPFNGEAAYSGPLLGNDGLMYGVTSLTQTSQPGSTYRYNPVSGTMGTFAPFSGDTGGNPSGVLIEGKDKYLYGTTTEYGGSTTLGPIHGTVFRINPPLSK
jgi:uncharacterized repeat protein (TIGR03803 family)